MQVGFGRQRHGLEAFDGHGKTAPGDQNDDHDRGDMHDLERLFARLMDADDVLPPKIKGSEQSKSACEERRWNAPRTMRVKSEFVDEAG